MSMMVEIPEGRLLVGGRWERCHSSRWLAASNPATGELIARAPLADEADVDRVASAASRAAAGWAQTPVLARAALVRRLAAAVRAHREELARLDTATSGNLLTAMRADIDWAADALDYFAGLAPELKGETLPGSGSAFSYTIREPYGVVLRINPFNHPARFAVEKLGAPLVAGNAVIVKPAEQAPLSSLVIARLAAEIFPPDVVSVVTGDEETGEALVRHPAIRRIVAIASVEAGRAIMRAASDELKTVSFELGGKNPLIILPDVDVEAAASFAVQAMNLGRAGQSCSSTSRIFVHRAIQAPFERALVQRLTSLTIASPEDERSQVGCLVSRERLDAVLRYVESGLREGARLLCGGKPPSDPTLARGCFLEPTAFTGVRPAMRIAREEIFGPVMTVHAWDDEASLVAMANDVIYGLSALIYTRDYGAAHRLTRLLQAGYVCVNIPGGHELGAPFGGVKQSGIGREECLDELLSYTQTKTVRIGF